MLKLFLDETAAELLVRWFKDFTQAIPGGKRDKASLTSAS